jgi:hypothetical protein
MRLHKRLNGLSVMPAIGASIITFSFESDLMIILVPLIIFLNRGGLTKSPNHIEDYDYWKVLPE